MEEDLLGHAARCDGRAKETRSARRARARASTSMN